MCEYLLTQRNPHCQNFDHTFDDPPYLQLDHNTPGAGGLNHISNRVCHANRVTGPRTGASITDALSYATPAVVTR